MWRPTEPSVALASKGLVSLDITVEGANTDLHSGRFGGTVANPVHVLSEILASLHDTDGTVAVPGFYDGIPPLTDERRRQIASRVLFRYDLSARTRALAGARRGWLLDARAAMGTADARRQRHQGRRQVHRHPARRGRPCLLPPCARPGSRCGHRRDHQARRQRASGGHARQRSPRRGQDSRLHHRGRSSRHRSRDRRAGVRLPWASRSCRSTSRGPFLRRSSSSVSSARRPCSSPSRQPTRSCMLRTSTCASGG